MGHMVLLDATDAKQAQQPEGNDRQNGKGRRSQPEVVIRRVRNADELDAVYRLTHDAYVWRGYCDPQPDGRLIHYPHLDNIPQTTVLMALDTANVIGTISITEDGPQGLHVDLDFGDVCDALRAEQLRLAASWRVATHHQCRTTRKISMSLVGEAMRLFWQSNADALLCTFNPRHEGFYHRVFHFNTIARDGSDVHGLKGAPAILMRLDRDDLDDKWRS